MLDSKNGGLTVIGSVRSVLFRNPPKMSFSLENGYENGVLGRESFYSGYGVRKAYEDGKIFVYLFNKCYFPLCV